MCFVAITAGTGAAAACSAFGSTADDAPSAPPDTGAPSDGAPGVADARPVDDAGGESGGPVTLLDDHFETGGTVCDGWDIHGASAERVADAGVGGSTACRVCTTVQGGGNVSRTTQAVATRGNYTVVAQVAKDPSSSGTQWTTNVFVDLGDDAAAQRTGFNDGILTGGWQTAQAAVNGVEPATTITVRFVTDSNAGECYLVDDVSATFTPSP